MSIEEQVLKVAARSPCSKRKVGAVIADRYGKIIGEGYNSPGASEFGVCEDYNGDTLPSVIHAEVNAIYNAKSKGKREHMHTIYVSHEPCKNCLEAIKEARIDNIVVIESFMKFDKDKLRYDLIPPSAMRGLATVLTYGAKKYKPNNWKEVEELDRYIAALYRHLEAWREGEKKDKESGLKHLEHALTNVAFLLELDSDDLGPDETILD